MGKPLYNNSAQHLISIQSRGGGKTYGSSGIAAHNFLFDGATDYDVYFQRKQSKKFIASDTIIGAIDTKYTDPVVKKVKKKKESVVQIDETMMLVLDKLNELEERLEKIEGRMGL